MMKTFTYLILALTLGGYCVAGLPPTTSKVSSDSANVTTFNYQFPNFTGTHTGTTVALGVNSIAGGGTGQATKAAAFDALSPMSASGDIIYGGASGTGTRLPKGSDGNVLTLASGLPSWAAPGGGFTQSGLYYGAFNNGTGANYWSRASSTLGAFSLTSTAFSLTDIYKYGFVTVTAKASNVPGITFTAPATGTVKVTVYAAFQPPTSQVADLQLVDGSATAISARQTFSPGSGNPYSNMTLSGFMNVTSASSYSVELYGATGNGATGFLNGGVNGVYGLNFMLEYVK